MHHIYIYIYTLFTSCFGSEISFFKRVANYGSRKLGSRLDPAGSEFFLLSSGRVFPPPAISLRLQWTTATTTTRTIRKDLARWFIFRPREKSARRDRCRGLIRSRNVFTWFHRIAVWLTRDIQFPCRRRMRRHEAPTVRLKTFDTRPSSPFLLRNNNNNNRFSFSFFEHRCNPRQRDSRPAILTRLLYFFFLRGMKKSRTSRWRRKKEKNCLRNGEINIGKCLLLNSRDYYACY